MRLRSRSGSDEAFDGLTAEEVRRIRGAAAVSVVPGMEGLAESPTALPVYEMGGEQPVRYVETQPKRKRGRRA